MELILSARFAGAFLVAEVHPLFAAEAPLLAADVHPLPATEVPFLHFFFTVQELKLRAV